MKSIAGGRPIRTAVRLDLPKNLLSEKHLKELYHESGISPEIVAERGYYTASKVEDVPAEFKTYQRRPGLVVPMYSPDGETVKYQVKPSCPRKDKSGKPIKYESATGSGFIADVHPRNRKRIKDASVPLVITEGIKTADAMTSRDLCVVALAGVWQFRTKGSSDLLPCFDHIALKGRTVVIVYDSDVMTKPEVMLALERLVGDLEKRGTSVWVCYLPDAPDGSKQGADDFLAAGGTVGKLLACARRFDRGDVREIRLSRDEKLHAGIGDLRRRWWRHEWKGIRAHSARDALEVLIREAEIWGKVKPEGIRVRMTSRTLALGTAISRRSVKGVLDWLEAEGWIRRDNEGRARDQAGAFVLFTNYARLPHYGEDSQPGREGGKGSNPSVCREHDPRGEALRSSAPRLRWSTLRRNWTPEGVYEYERVERLGKIAGAALETLAHLGGDATVRELANALGRGARPTEFRRRQLSRLETAEIIVIEGDRVRLVPEWGAKVELARELAGEIQAGRLQAQSYERQREAFYRKGEIKPESVPDMQGMDDTRASWSRHSDGCACSECSKRFGRVIGEHVEGCACRECFSERKGQITTSRIKSRERRYEPVRRLRLVEIPTPVQTPKPEPVLATAPGASEDWRNHPLDCDCDDCASPMPTYVSLGREKNDRIPLACNHAGAGDPKR
jgi:hypothetical protein